VIKRKLAGIVAGVAALSLLATACSSDNDPKEEPNASAKPSSSGAATASDKILVVGMPNQQQQPNQNPLAAGSASLSLGYAFAVYESLMQVNELKPKDPPTPWLAESVEWNADSTEAVITAREGVKWSDGTPFTAEDIQFSIQLRKDNEALNTDFPGQYGDITLDGNKVTVKFTTGQFVNQVKLLKLLIVPKHLWKDQDPIKWTDDEMIGTGPFKLKTFTPQSVSLEPNADYWGTKPLVGGLRYDTFNDNNGLTTALTTGEAHWGWVFIPDFENTFIAKDPEHYHQVAGGGFGVDVLFLNNEKGAFKNKAMRQALNMVVDRADVSATAGYGVWPQIKSVTGLPSGTGDAYLAPEYQGKELTVDVEGAKTVLKDAGYTWDGGGALIDPEGKKVSFKLTDPSGWTDYLDALGIIKEGAAKLGASVDDSASPQATWEKNLPAGDFDGSLHWTDGGFTPWNMYSNIMDGASYVELGKPATWNFGRYKNDEATKALADFKSGTSDAARQDALNIVQKRFVEDVPGLVIWQRPAVAQYSTKDYTGFPSDEDPYANPQPTGPQAALILSKLVPTQD
jgi:peptide/nickel transport system substrate-binding protein